MRVAAIPVGIGLLLAQFILGACAVGKTETPLVGETYVEVSRPRQL